MQYNLLFVFVVFVVNFCVQNERRPRRRLEKPTQTAYHLPEFPRFVQNVGHRRLTEHS